MALGMPSRWVCWLAVPTPLDQYIPEDHTLVYVLKTPYEGIRGQYPKAFWWDLDREATQRYMKALYMSRTRFEFHTEWYDPEGRLVYKHMRRKDHHENQDQSSS